jgi:hypothetical protein
MSIQGAVDRPPARLAAENTINPARNTRLRP